LLFLTFFITFNIKRKMDSKYCEYKKRILLQTKFFNQIFNLQSKIQEFLVNWSLFPSNFEKLTEEHLKNFKIERALEKINTLNNEIQSKTNTVLELIRPTLPPFP
jgi:low affinity Fe/Cu permease